MRKSIILCVALAVITLTGCSKDEGNNPTDGRTALSVSSGIQTRVVGDTWEAGDAIGIYMLNGLVAEASNNKYTTATESKNGTFTSAGDQTIYFPVDGSTRDFIAYYPYITNLTGTTYNVNVATQSSQPAIDLMSTAKVTGKSKNDPAVAFVFEHKLVKLDITVKADGVSLTDDDLIGTTVTITNQQTAATYDVVTGGAVSVTNGAATEIALKMTGLKAEGIVLPNVTTEGMKLTFTVPKLNNQVFEWAIKDAVKSQMLESGNKYKYTITIAKAGLTVISTVMDWAEGNGDGETGDAE